MTNQEFLSAFEKHLNVGGLQRDEIIAELQTHLDEEGPTKLGDPKVVAERSNRVHLGLFSSFQRLVQLRIGTFILFEIIGLLIINRWGLRLRPLSDAILLVSTIAPTIFTLLGAHAIGNMHHRWVRLLQWCGIMTTCALFSLLLTQTYGSVYFPPELNIPWWYATQIFESFVVTLLLSVAVITAGSGRRAWLPQHPWIDILLAFILQGVGALLLVGYIVNISNSYLAEVPATFDEVIFWIENNPFTYAITIGLLGGVVEAIRIYYFGKQHKKS